MPEQITDEMRAAANRRGVVSQAIGQLSKAHAVKRRGVDATPVAGEQYEIACEALARVDGDELRRVLAELDAEYTKEKEPEPRAPHVTAPASMHNPFGP